MADGVTEARNGSHTSFSAPESSQPGPEEHAAEALLLRNRRSSDEPE